jgi:hypothetical protein
MVFARSAHPFIHIVFNFVMLIRRLPVSSAVVQRFIFECVWITAALSFQYAPMPAP